MDAHAEEIDRIYQRYREKHAQLEKDIEAVRERVPTIWPKNSPLPMLNRAEFEARIARVAEGSDDTVLWLRGLIDGLEESFPSLLAILETRSSQFDSAA